MIALVTSVEVCFTLRIQILSIIIIIVNRFFIVNIDYVVLNYCIYFYMTIYNTQFTKLLCFIIFTIFF